MKLIKIRQALRVLILAPSGLLALLLIEALFALAGGAAAFRKPSQEPRLLGEEGPPLVYVVMGDSTAAGQGGDYDRGIAVATARHLARSHRVIFANLAVSGATTADVVRHQLPAALCLKPELILLSVGANDVTSFTRNGRLERGLLDLADRLQQARPGVRVVITGVPDMGSIPRFAQPLRWLAGIRTHHVNAAFASAVAKRRPMFVWARIARETGPLFRRDAALFSHDRFHPNTRGYDTWTRVLNPALDSALKSGAPVH